MIIGRKGSSEIRLINLIALRLPCSCIEFFFNAFSLFESVKRRFFMPLDDISFEMRKKYSRRRETAIFHWKIVNTFERKSLTFLLAFLRQILYDRLGAGFVLFTGLSSFTHCFAFPFFIQLFFLRIVTQSDVYKLHLDRPQEKELFLLSSAIYNHQRVNWKKDC